jgi:hypothetical protein
MPEPERWKKCKHSNPNLYKNKSVYCTIEQGYVSEKWCEFCSKFEDK